MREARKGAAKTRRRTQLLCREFNVLSRCPLLVFGINFFDFFLMLLRAIILNYSMFNGSSSGSMDQVQWINGSSSSSMDQVQWIKRLEIISNISIFFFFFFFFLIKNVNPDSSKKF